MKRISALIVIFGVLLGACGETVRAPYAIFAPLSPLFATVEVQLVRVSGEGEAELALNFAARDGQVLAFAVRAEGGQLVMAQDLRLAGIEAGAALTPAVLREVLVAGGVVSAGQFKVQDAEVLLALLSQMAVPGVAGFDLPPAYELVETNIGQTGGE